MASLRKQVFHKNLPPMPMPTSTSSIGSRKAKKEYTSLSWEGYFDSLQDVEIEENKRIVAKRPFPELEVFRVYQSGLENSPVLLLLHGGGHSALSWAVFSKTLQQKCTCRVVAIDFRGHGDTCTKDDYDLSKETLLKDVEQVIDVLFQGEPPPIVLIGHSMGGAIAIHLTAERILSTVIALIVIDVVEGTALEALAHMRSFLRNRPQSFKSIEHAIEWHVKSGQIRNLESARVSVPKQINKTEVVSGEDNDDFKVPKKYCIAQEPVIMEEPPGDDVPATATATEKIVHGTFYHEYCGKFCGKKFPHLLIENKPNYDWFKDISRKFLSSSVPKLLLLAGVDRLDKELTIGQMQGKFQFHVLSDCGHVIHEDVPQKTSNIIGGFLVRNKFSVAKEGFMH